MDINKTGLPKFPFRIPNCYAIEVRLYPGLANLRVTFMNGYSASVSQGFHSIGGKEGYWEVAVLGPTLELDYTTPLMNDTLGWCDVHRVEALLQRIFELPYKPGYVSPVTPQSAA